MVAAKEDDPGAAARQPRETTQDPTPASRNTSRSSRDSSPILRRDASLSHARQLRKQPSTGLIPSLPPSLGASPQTSRNTSPIRQTSQHQGSPQPPANRSIGASPRLNSQDASPIRPASSQLASSSTVGAPPSAAAIQRALSSAHTPQLLPGPAVPTESASKVNRQPRAAGNDAQTAPSPSFSPRVKSPGPSAPSSRRNSSHRRSELAVAPPITVQSATPPPAAGLEAPKQDTNGDSQTVQAGKAAARGPSGPKSSLQTVQENTPPSNTILADSTDQSFFSMNSSQTSSKSSDGDRTPTAASKSSDAQSRSAESDADGNKSDGKGRKDATPQDPNRLRLVSSKTAPLPARNKQIDGTRNMTVETETVQSIPQSAINQDRSNGTRGDNGGSIRAKPSTETIRPRKERKRASRKAPSIHNGTASSKADIFEARVASQVDEANSSDSDETFVYESNPPEPQMRSTRNHSRTPSVTSIHSQSERRQYRGFENHRVAGKRSMKFSNNPYCLLDSPTDGDSGTIRAHHPRNISRFGRNVGSNSSLYEQDSPFTQASKLRANIAGTTRQSSRPTTPQSSKTSNAGQDARPVPAWARKQGGLLYDFDGEGADDERAPLIGTVRTPRNRHLRRGQNRPYENIYNIQQTSWLGRFGGCLLGSLIVIMVALGAVSFLFMSNRGLYDVEIHEIRNVFASEQEIMLDMVVGAINPNVLGISVTEMDIIVFAKSKHLATSSSVLPSATPKPVTAQRRRLEAQAEHKGPGTPWQDPDGHWDDDRGDTPLEGDSQTMLLGRVYKLDQGLYFDGSPLRRHPHTSVGEFRLSKPGNRTEAGGSARWERVLQYPFELILRGVLNYQLPITAKDQSAAIAGSVIVHPEEGLQHGGKFRTEPTRPQDKWEWIEPGDAGRIVGPDTHA